MLNIRFYVNSWRKGKNLQISSEGDSLWQRRSPRQIRDVEDRWEARGWGWKSPATSVQRQGESTWTAKGIWSRHDDYGTPRKKQACRRKEEEDQKEGSLSNCRQMLAPMKICGNNLNSPNPPDHMSWMHLGCWVTAAVLNHQTKPQWRIYCKAWPDWAQQVGEEVGSFLTAWEKRHVFFAKCLMTKSIPSPVNPSKPQVGWGL